jgi:hypothetical protein
MGARQKLNQAYLNGALVIAAVIGAVTQSWTVFWLAALFAAGISLHAGNIRLRGRGKQ